MSDSDSTYFILAGILLTPVVGPLSYMWTRYCIRSYRRWAR